MIITVELLPSGGKVQIIQQEFLLFVWMLKEVSIFKDVPGVLNADPREFEETTLIEQISYKEAIEMAFYGASVIHPKNIAASYKERIFP